MELELKNIKSQLKKGNLEFCVLLLLSKGKKYSLDIINNLKIIGIDLPKGTIYPLLLKMEKNNLISCAWGESDSGPLRKYYSITTSGKKYLAKLKEEWLKFNKSIILLIKQNEK